MKYQEEWICFKNLHYSKGKFVKTKEMVKFSESSDVSISSGSEKIDDFEPSIYRIPTIIWTQLEGHWHKFMLVKIKGERRNSIYYRYVCMAMADLDDDDGTVRVNGLKSINAEKLNL
jgi:hypothetical protein